MKLRKALYQHALQGIFLFQLLLFKFILTMAWQQSWQALHSICSARHSQALRIRHLPALNRGNVVQLSADLLSLGSAGCCRPGGSGAVLYCDRAMQREVGQLTHISWRCNPRHQAVCSASCTARPETLPGIAGAMHREDLCLPFQFQL